MDVCLRVFCVCVGSGFATGWSPVQGVLPTVLGLTKLGETKRFTDDLCSKWEQQDRHKEREREREKKGLNIIYPLWCFYSNYWRNVETYDNYELEEMWKESHNILKVPFQIMPGDSEEDKKYNEVNGACYTYVYLENNRS
jgi:hypothetical protein